MQLAIKDKEDELAAMKVTLKQNEVKTKSVMDELNESLGKEDEN